MKKFVLLSALASLALMTGCASSQSAISNSRIRVRSFVDGCDVIKVRGDQVWYVHKAYELPGRWQGCNEPTLVNGEKWYPQWDGTVSDRFVIADKDNALPIEKEFTAETLKVTSNTVLGDLIGVQYPSAENDYTFSVTLDDRGAEGASWYELGLDWED